MPSRRTFLKWTAAAGAAILATGAGLYAFLRSRNPYLTGGYEPVGDELVAAGLKISGEIPPALNGTYIRNGPNPIFPRENYVFWDGDGMLHAVEIHSGTASYRNRFVRTAAYADELAAGKSLHPFPFKETPQVNRVNAGVIWHHGKLLALSINGPAMKIDPETLIGTQLYSFNETWYGGILPRTKIDPDNGHLHFWALRSPSTCYYKIADRAGKIIFETEIDFKLPATFHDFAITKNYTLFSKAPLDLQNGGQCQIGRLARGAKEVEWIDVSKAWLQGVINAYEEGDEIVLHGLRDPNGNRTAMPHEWRLNFAKKSVSEKPISDKFFTLPAIHPSYTGKPYEYAYLSAITTINRTPRLRKFHIRADQIRSDVFEFGENCYGGDFTFVPDSQRPNKEDGGWLVGFVLDERRDESHLYIIDAETLSLTAKIQCPRRVPHGLLGTWLPGP